MTKVLFVTAIIALFVLSACTPSTITHRHEHYTVIFSRINVARGGVLHHAPAPAVPSERITWR